MESDGGMPVIRGWLLLGGLGGFQSNVSPKGETGIPHTKSLKAEFRLKGASEVALVIFLALPGCSLANSHDFLPISVHKPLSFFYFLLNTLVTNHPVELLSN